MATTPTPDQSPLRVLIAEKDPFRRLLHRTMAERLGLRVVEASGGTEAVKLAAAERPDLVLVEAQLPGLDSVESLCRSMRGEGAAPGDRPPAVVVLAYPEGRPRREDFRTNPGEVLVMPFNSVALKGLMERLFPDRTWPEPLL